MNSLSTNKNFFLRNLPVIAAFFIPVITLFLLFAFREIFPFGDYMYMKSDSYHQYLTFFKEFQSILKNGDSLLYSWNIGLGQDFPSTYAYYLATPVYWISALLPSNYLPEFMESTIILKAGLMSATFAYYIQCRTKKRSFITAFFGIFYAMSSYMAAYSWNLMWLDNLALLPLIALGLERLVREKKTILYTVSLAIAILSNYYIAIMICIFLVLYFLYVVFCEPGKKGIAHKLKSLGRFAAHSVIAGLMAAVTVFPAFINLASTASGSSTFPTKLKAYFNFLEMISHAIMNVEPTILKGYIPNIYCTIALFMLIPLYIICKKVSVPQKIGKVILLAVFLVSFSLNIPTFIWHGFHYPNSLSSRQSFIYIFLVLTMACEAILEIKEFRYREIITCFVAGLIAIYGLQVLFSSETYTVLFVSVSAIFLLLYFVWCMLARFNKLPAVVMIIALLAIVVTEAAINTDATGYSVTNRVSYMSDNESITNLLESIDDDGFYRVEKVKRRTKNDGAWLNYRSASEFSSALPDAISDFYDSFGMQSSTNSFSYYGHTYVSSAFLGVKYEISPTELNDSMKTLIGEDGGIYLYENNYVLPLGFMVNESTSANTKMSNSNPFVVQSSFIEAACGISDVFDISNLYQGKTPSGYFASDGRAYAYINEKLSKAHVTITRGGETILDADYSDLENPQIIDLGDVRSGDKVTITSQDEDVTTISFYSAVLDIDTYKKAIETLSSCGLEISDFGDTYVEGTVNASNEGLMLTSIPYSQGWDVYVDGEKVESWGFYGAFLTFHVSEGEHNIEFRYHSPGLLGAALVSVFAILLFVVLSITRRYFKNTRKIVRKSADLE